MNATNGHPLYVAALSARVAAGEDMVTAMVTAMTPPLGTLTRSAVTTITCSWSEAAAQPSCGRSWIFSRARRG